jgi:hypothetical protein
MIIKRNILNRNKRGIKDSAIEAAALWIYHNGEGRLVDIYSQIQTGQGRPFKRLITKGNLGGKMRGDKRFIVINAGRPDSTWGLTQKGVYWVENKA